MRYIFKGYRNLYMGKKLSFTFHTKESIVEIIMFFLLWLFFLSYKTLIIVSAKCKFIFELQKTLRKYKVIFSIDQIFLPRWSVLNSLYYLPTFGPFEPDCTAANGLTKQWQTRKTEGKWEVGGCRAAAQAHTPTLMHLTLCSFLFSCLTGQRDRQGDRATGLHDRWR